MLAFSVLTPYYNEEVIFSKHQLKEENEDGVTILFYLQRIFPGNIEVSSVAFQRGLAKLTDDLSLRVFYVVYLVRIASKVDYSSFLLVQSYPG